MLRPFAGVLDLGDGGGRDRAMQALPRAGLGDDVQITDAGTLVVAAPDSPGGQGDVICIIDGGVYNSEELAAELGLERSEQPETVLAAGYRRWGGALASRLRGEFAALIWDRRHARGLLLPDQLGVRSIFLRSEGRRLWFGTEVRNVLACLPSRPAPDPVAISHWLARTSSPDGATVYEGISGLPWGHLVELNSDGWAVQRYWQPEFQEPLQMSRGELVEEIQESLCQAVDRRLDPVGPTGVLMSGGLDSTSVAALAHYLAPDGAVAFASTFPNYPHINEVAWLDAVESHVDLPTVRYAAQGPGIIASGLEHLLHWDLPPHAWGDPWFQPLLRGARERGLTTILGGEGGDELFGSRFYLGADLMHRGRLVSAARFLRGLPEFGSRASKRSFAELFWRFGVGGLPSATITAAWQRTPWGDSAPWWASKRCANMLRAGAPPSWQDAVGPRWWAFCTHSLTDAPHASGLLDQVRRRAEQVGLEARQPLYDVDLIDLMLRVPPEACSVGDLSRPLLREAMRGFSPDAVRLRPKKSVFDHVIADALTGPEQPVLLMILENASEIGDYVNQENLRELLENSPPRQRGPTAIWALDVLRLAGVEIWLRYQEDRSLPERLLEDRHVQAS
jgi:asparagine synthase (glutamine-hydrolysing)